MQIDRAAGGFLGEDEVVQTDHGYPHSLNRFDRATLPSSVERNPLDPRENVHPDVVFEDCDFMLKKLLGRGQRCRSETLVKRGEP